MQFVAMAPRRIPHRASRPDTALAALCYCALCCCAIATLAAAQQAPRYRVRAARLNGGEPVLSSATGASGALKVAHRQIYANAPQYRHMHSMCNLRAPSRRICC